MKKALTILLVLVSVLIILDSLNAGHALFMFLLAGVVPGTNIVISAGNMLEFFTLLIGFTLSRITIHLIHLAETQKKTARAPRQQARLSTARA